EVKEIMNSSDCLLMTSITEGSPQVIKESLSCGLPIVSVPVGDVSEMIDNVPNCFISSYHDAKELAKLVDKVLKSNSHGIREAFLLKTQFSNRSISKTIAKFYDLDKLFNNNV